MTGAMISRPENARGVGFFWCRAAAIQAGAVPALCSVLQVGAQRRVPIALDDVLRALYALAAADASGHSAARSCFSRR